jgi:outer membrane autotransporter protein
MADAAKVINITADSVLDLAGHSPLITTIIGSVNNDGTLNFHHSSDDADDITNIYGNYTAFNNAQMIIDVNPTTKTSDLMIVDGDVAGTTKVTVYRITDGTTTDLIKFVEAPNDDATTGAYFTVHRVYAEALDITDQWKVVHQDNAWYVTSVDTATNASDGYGTSDTGDLDVDIVTDVTLPDNFPTAPTINPDNPNNPNKPSGSDVANSKIKLVPEALAYLSLPRVGIEQTRDLVRVISNKVTSTKTMSGRCGMSECEYNGRAVYGAWVDLGHKMSDIDTPATVEAKIKAVDFGFDIQKDLNNRLGVFASYRQGEYELSGDGEEYYSKTGSEIEIDSWMLGLYHRYDKNNLWVMSSIYGGLQKVEVGTDDGVSADTDGMQIGGSVEAGIVFEPQKRLTVEPSIRLGYNFLKYDEISDGYGKTAEFDNVQNIEVEAGVKVEKTWFTGKNNVAKLYVKPSIIQNIGKGDVNITSLKKIKGVENQTLIRGEVGGSCNFRNGWSGFGAVGHTLGDDYNATDYNVGLSYSW